MSDFSVTFIDNELDQLGYPSKVCVVRNDGLGVREYRPYDKALLRETYGGQIRCSCCGRQLKRDYITGWNKGWRYCIGCGARIIGVEWEP